MRMSFPSSRSLRVMALCATAVSAAALAGCQSGQTSAPLAATNDYRLRHPIVITEQAETLDLPVGQSTRNLNRDFAERVTEFGQASRRNGNGHVEILVPSGAANEAAVHAVTPRIRSALALGGVSGTHVSTRSYPVDDATAQAPIRLAYTRIKASAGPCGEWPANIGGSLNANQDYYNFGCATQANLAAMVDNPADLLGPRAMTPADQMRRATVFQKYRAGEQTASDYKEGDGASVSDSN
ncbi:CpaD family pilus assembly protein [Polymorphum gilvum]|uniref:Pilus biogenesis lipoprotein CpaD n=1 Tax=Polymorphum gilvum (strain LMG 25793 / CGMCC 1.9160 / SL003B-26A1) TaxID=991905 RepID=F2J2Q9_POLGS|nr:CpaD family pilus assembly protein [Polymorphum gilvum]ADZ72083.1 Pilus biogenesis lipoprotein CpaD [Polymorphum gilvum SL003B-26A1]